ncbi:hypothetical protein CARUB_v10020211mg [Capsella rubella]|uniref:Protein DETOXIFICATION n=1 Tax=Capsella rubella TaxID=81985 RepID=R0I9X9_9BRAS|nr:hypothetical protein CARUB_v10020211mg [Capsella rubella]
MCNSKPSSSSSSLLSSKDKTHFSKLESCDTDNPHYSEFTNNDSLDLKRWPTFLEGLEEVKAIGKISGPTALTGLLMYSRAMISMLFLGYLGELELAGGSLSIGFANITGYSVISGLSMGMEPICGQAYGAKQMKLLGLTLQRTVLLLLSCSVPISFSWLNMRKILLWCGQDEEISSVAQKFLLFAIPDLFLLSILHPLRIYLRTQNITLPVTYSTAVSVLLHVPLNFLLVVKLEMGVAGVAIAMVLTNLNLVVLLSSFVYFTSVHSDTWVPVTIDSLKALVYVFPSSLSLGVSTRIGNELGARRPAKARVSMIISLFCAAALGLMAMVFAVLVRHRWGRLFTTDAEILELTSIALPIVGLCELGNCPQTTGCGVLRGCARPTLGANINLGSFYFVGMPVAILFGFVFKQGFPGLWLGLLAAQATCASLMLCALLRTDWAVQAERAEELTSESSEKTPPLLPIARSKSQSNSGTEDMMRTMLV